MNLSDHQTLSILATGQTVIDVANGKSMEPRIIDGQRIMIEPFQHREDQLLKVGDIVFVAIKGKFLHHQIIEMKGSRGPFVIGNIHNKIDGIVTIDKIYGIVKPLPK
jgi:hypothetical protein